MNLGDFLAGVAAGAIATVTTIFAWVYEHERKQIVALHFYATTDTGKGVGPLEVHGRIADQQYRGVVAIEADGAALAEICKRAAPLLSSSELEHHHRITGSTHRDGDTLPASGQEAIDMTTTSETFNRFGVSVQGEKVLLLMPPLAPFSREDALNLAAWLVAVADQSGGVDFAALLRKVRAT